MRITVLGKSPAWADAGGACSGYLIDDGETTVLLDCGNGVFGKLREHVDYTDVDAVVISHVHADHCIDLIPYAYALLLTPRQQPVPVAGHPGTDDPARPRLIVPPGARQLLRTVVGAWGDEELIEQAFVVEDYDQRLQGRDRLAARRSSPRCRISSSRTLSSSPRATATGASPSAPTRVPARRSSSSRATPTCSCSRQRCRDPSAPGSGGT